MTDTGQLLRDYAERQDELAFDELVKRHIDLVYSTALRQLSGDAQLAQDIAQVVFTDLARKAKTLPREVVLGGWLYRHTCFTAAKALRTERRRQIREHEAAIMNAQNEPSDEIWRQVAPVLDQAMNQLNERDRDAIVLRFFEHQPLREVGAALGASEDAARMRVDRALEKLRKFLTRQGVMLSATGLAAVLTAEAVTAAPLGLAAGVTGAALAGAAATTGTTLTLLKFMAITKLKTCAVGALVVATAVTPLLWEQHRHNQLLAENAELRRPAALAETLRSENEWLRLAPPDPSAVMALRRAGEERQADRAELMRLRAQASAAQREQAERADQVQRRIAQQKFMHQSDWTNVPPNEIQEIPVDQRVVVSNLQNVGTATPEAALETYLWIVRQQDLEGWLNARYTPEYRAAFGIGASEDFQKQLAVEKEALDGITALKLRREEVHGENQVAFLYDCERDHERTKDEPMGGSLQLKKMGDEWKVYIVGWTHSIEPRPRRTARP